MDRRAMEKNYDKTCCFTGHRPMKLGISESEAKELLEKTIKRAITYGFSHFISGMAEGIDMWAAEIVLRKRDEGSKIELICAVPHPNFEKRWDEQSRQMYQSILDRADVVETISKHYYPSCYQIRNIWMVDRSDMVIAAYSGAKGGTFNTISYANRKKIPVYNILN